MPAAPKHEELALKHAELAEKRAARVQHEARVRCAELPQVVVHCAALNAAFPPESNDAQALNAAQELNVILFPSQARFPTQPVSPV